jgi:hypothetical protein
MKRCDNCGLEFEDNINFCTNCGGQLHSVDNEPKIKYCSQCGSQISDDMKFCTMCGLELTPVTPVDATTPKEKKTKVAPKKKIIMICVICFVLLAGAIGIMYATRGLKKSTIIDSSENENFVSDTEQNGVQEEAQEPDSDYGSEIYISQNPDFYSEEELRTMPDWYEENGIVVKGQRICEYGAYDTQNGDEYPIVIETFYDDNDEFSKVSYFIITADESEALEIKKEEPGEWVINGNILCLISDEIIVECSTMESCIEYNKEIGLEIIYK